jgi:hypothetical protein
MTDKPRQRARLKVDVEDAHLTPEGLWFAPFAADERAAYERLMHRGWPPEVADKAVRQLRQQHAESRKRHPPLRAGEVVDVVLAFPHYDGEPEAENGLLVEGASGARALVLRGDTEPAPPEADAGPPVWEGHYA